MAASKLIPVVAKAAGPLLKKNLPKIARAVTKSSPHLTKGIGKVARMLHRRPRTRSLLKTVPAIARRTVGSIARQAARGRHITPRTAVRTLARQTARVLGTPAQRRHALRRHNHLERRFHRHFGRPHWRYGRGRRYGASPRRGRYGQAPRAAGSMVPRVVQGAVGPASAPSARPGRIVAGRCTCSPCPSCGTASAQSAPAYCRCCGQVLR